MLFFIWLFYSAFSILKRLFWSPQHVPVPPAPESSAFVSTKRKMAILKGGALNALRWIAYVPILGSLYIRLQHRLLHFHTERFFKFDFSHFPGTVQSNVAISCLNKNVRVEDVPPLTLGPVNHPGFRFPSFDDYAAAYKSGKVTPVDVAKRVIAAVKKSTGTLNAIINLNEQVFLAEAEASLERHKSGKTLSEFDGIPITIKDESDVKGYRTSVGTNFINRGHIAENDSVVVARLRAKGFLIAGKSNMMEIGIAPFGYNKNFGHCKTPYDLQCDSGGSSSGSACAVGAGIVPCAIGADGGGSIRVPAAFCGVVGLKANVNRVPECEGIYPLCFSVGHIGPICSNVRDTFSVYQIIKGPDAGDILSASVPRSLPRFPCGNKWRIGICREWADLCVDAALKENYLNSIKSFEQQGATIVPFTIHCFDELRLAHTTTILSEMRACMTPFLPMAHNLGAMANMSLDLGSAFDAVTYVQSQKIRTWGLKYFNSLFETQFDIIVSPTTAALPPRFHLADDMHHGVSDAETLLATMCFVFIANLLGNPAISVCNGYDAKSGLPTGLQIMSQHGNEEDCIAAAAFVESKTSKKRPSVFFDIL